MLGPMARAPELSEIEAARERLGDLVRTTPVWEWRGPEPARRVGEETRVFLKLELLQYSGSFKPRGALTEMFSLDPAALRRGVVAVSAGNHAMAVAYAARVLGTTLKVVMPEHSDPARVTACRESGAEVVLVEHMHRAFAHARAIGEEEGRHLVHPFEGPRIALGTATVGLELCRQVEDLDAVVVPIGGGGLCAGVARAVKLLSPRCRVIGVEPEGADTMHRSFRSGRPEAIEAVRTIADSLGAPAAEPYSFEVCRDHVDELALVSDDELRDGMALLFHGMKLAVEPAGAAATAALVGPLRERLRGRRVALIVCGANIDPAAFAAHLAATRTRGS
jgi:threonine dehydratase